MPNHPKRVFITGINRGLGRATAKLAAIQGHEVIGTVRKEEYRNAVEVEINQEVLEAGGLGRVQALQLDARRIDLIPDKTLEELERADILINNSGVGVDLFQPHIHLSNFDDALLDEAIQVNAKAALRLMNIAMPAMKARGWGRVVNVSSVLAQMSCYIGETAAPAYRLSKILLNGITALAAEEYRDSGILVNSVCPGWCRTDMGRDMAPDTPDQGADRIWRIACLPDRGPTGTFFVNDQPAHF